jgi:hypothetical protein
MSTSIIFDNTSNKLQSILQGGLTHEINSHFYFTIQKKDKHKSEILSELQLFNDIPNRDFIKSVQEKVIKDNYDLIFVINITLLCNQIVYGREHFCKDLESNKEFNIFLNQNPLNDFVGDFSTRGIKFSDSVIFDKFFCQVKDLNSTNSYIHPLWLRILNASTKKKLIEIHKTKNGRNNFIEPIRRNSKLKANFKLKIFLLPLMKLLIWL